MNTYSTINDIEQAILQVGDTVRILGERTEGDIATMTGRVRAEGTPISNRVVYSKNGLPIEVFPVPAAEATKEFVEGEIHDFHTDTVKDVWQAGQQITSWVHKIYQDGEYRIPKTVPFITKATWESDKVNWVILDSEQSTLRKVFGSEPVTLTKDLVITPTNNQYPKLAAFGAIYELADNSISYTVKSFMQSVGGDCVITLSDNSLLIAHKADTLTSNAYAKIFDAKVTSNVELGSELNGYNYLNSTKLLEIPDDLTGTFVSADFQKGILQTSIESNILMLKKNRKGRTLYSSQLFIQPNTEIDATYMNDIVIPYAKKYGYSFIEFGDGDWLFSDTIVWLSGVAPSGVGVGNATALERTDQPSTVFKCSSSFPSNKPLFLFNDKPNLVVSSLQVQDFKIDLEDKNVNGILMQLPYDFVSIIDVMIDNIHDKRYGIRVDNDSDAFGVSQTLYSQNLFVRKKGMTTNNNVAPLQFRRLQESCHMLLKVFAGENSPHDNRAACVEFQDCKSITFYTPSFAHAYIGFNILSGNRTSTQISCYSPTFEGISYRAIKATGGSSPSSRISNIFVINPRFQHPTPSDKVVYEINNSDQGFLDCGNYGAKLLSGTSQVEVKAQRLHLVQDSGTNNFVHSNPNAIETNEKSNSGFENTMIKTGQLRQDKSFPKSQMVSAGAGNLEQDISYVICNANSNASYVLPLLTDATESNPRVIHIKNITETRTVTFTATDAVVNGGQNLTKGSYVAVGYGGNWYI